MANFSLNFSREQLEAVRQKSSQTGLTESELVRLAVASFLAQENSLTEYLSAIEVLDKKLAILIARQEQFTRAIGSASLAGESDRTPENRKAFIDRMAQIVETIS